MEDAAPRTTTNWTQRVQERTTDLRKAPSERWNPEVEQHKTTERRLYTHNLERLNLLDQLTSRDRRASRIWPAYTRWSFVGFGR